MTITHRPLVLQARARHMHPLALLGVLLLTLVLAGCGVNGASGPSLAAQVNGAPISLADYQAVLRYARAAAVLNNTPADWQSPMGRSSLTSIQDQALNFLIESTVLQDQLVKCQVSVSSKLQTQATQQIDNAREQVRARATQNPAFVALADAYTPELAHIFASRNANEEAMGAAGGFKMPSAHLRYILAGSRTEAEQLLAQAKGGADFAQLAKAHSLDQQSAASGGELGIVYEGQITQLGTDFDKQVFTGMRPRSASGCLNANTYRAGTSYVIIPARDQAFLFEVTEQADRGISSLQDAQQRQQVFSGWLDEQAVAGATIQRYITAPTQEKLPQA